MTNIVRTLPDYIVEAQTKLAEKLTVGMTNRAKEHFISGWLHGYYEAHVENGSIDDQDTDGQYALLNKLNNNFEGGKVRVIKAPK